MTNEFLIGNLDYWIAITLIILVEQMTFGRWWKRREAHRWTMGYITVFALGLPLVVRGTWDFDTFGGLFIAVGIAGMLKTSLEALVNSWQAEKLRRVANDPERGE